MAINITLFYSKKGAKHKGSFHLQDNGVYWFLYPYFMHLYERTGQMIDLYGVSNFRSYDLQALDSELADAIKGAAAQPDQWDQEVGMMIKPKKQILYDRVSKSDVLAAIDLLKNITTEAIKNNAVIVFEGL